MSVAFHFLSQGFFNQGEFLAMDDSKQIAAKSAASEPTAEPGSMETKEQKRSIRYRLVNGESPIHNFDGDIIQQWRLSAMVCGAEPIEGDKAGDDVIDLKYYYCHNVPMVSQATGDEIEAPRTVLVGKNGKMYRFVAASVIDALDNLIAILGPGPYLTKVQFKIATGKSRKGNKIYSFSPV